MSTDAPYFIGMGSILLADRDQTTGEPGTFVDVGEVPQYEVMVEVEYKDNFETSGLISRQDAHIVYKQTAKMRIVMKEHTRANMALALYGTQVAEGTGAFAAVAFPTVVVGDVRKVPGDRTMLSGVTIVDSAGTPATLTLGTHYSIDLTYGLVTFINLASFTQPFKIAGSEAAGKTSVVMLNRRSQEKVLMFNGINIGDDDKKVQDVLYRVAFGPSSKFPGKVDNFAEYEYECAVLFDKTKGVDPTYGNFGRHRFLE